MPGIERGAAPAHGRGVRHSRNCGGQFVFRVWDRPRPSTVFVVERRGRYGRGGHRAGRALGVDIAVFDGQIADAVAAGIEDGPRDRPGSPGLVRNRRGAGIIGDDRPAEAAGCQPLNGLTGDLHRRRSLGSGARPGPSGHGRRGGKSRGPGSRAIANRAVRTKGLNAVVNPCIGRSHAAVEIRHDRCGQEAGSTQRHESCDKETRHHEEPKGDNERRATFVGVSVSPP